MKEPTLEEQIAVLQAENAALKEKIADQEIVLRLVENSVDGLWDWNLLTGDDYLSPRWKRIFGYGDHELTDRVETWEKLLHPDDVGLAYAAINAHFTEGKPYEVVLRYLCKDGSVAWMLARGKAIQDREGNWVRMVGSQTNLTQLKLAEAELRKSQERYWRFFQGAGIPLIEEDLTEVHARLSALGQRGISDLRQHLLDNPSEALEIASAVRTLDINRAALELFEARELSEIVQAKKRVWLQMTSAFLVDTLLAIAEQRASFEAELELQTVAGTRRTVIFMLTLEPTAEQLSGRLGLLDITARRQAEQQARSLNAALEQRTQELALLNQELESFAYSASHDLRAPLRAIDGFSRLLEQACGTNLDNTARSYVDRIHINTRKMARLIDDLLALSRVARSAMIREKIDLSALARDIVTELRAAEPERSAEVLIADGLHALGDPGLLRIVLANLLENAWKFTRHHEQARIEVGRLPDRGAFYVKDNGAGFDMQYIDKLFRPFQRLHHEAEFPGNGIGLATVDRIIRRHGGQIRAEGAVDRGATFYFHLGTDQTDETATGDGADKV